MHPKPVNSGPRRDRPRRAGRWPKERGRSQATRCRSWSGDEALRRGRRLGSRDGHRRRRRDRGRRAAGSRRAAGQAGPDGGPALSVPRAMLSGALSCTVPKIGWGEPPARAPRARHRLDAGPELGVELCRRPPRTGLPDVHHRPARCRARGHPSRERVRGLRGRHHVGSAGIRRSTSSATVREASNPAGRCAGGRDSGRRWTTTSVWLRPTTGFMPPTPAPPQATAGPPSGR